MASTKSAKVQYRQWNVSKAEAVLLLVHGFGGHPGRWEPLADYFSSRGVASYALSLRGFGDTLGVKGHVDSFNTYLCDIESLVWVMRQDYPHQKLFLLGESLGALICFLMAIRKEELFKGLICLSPAFASMFELDVKTFWSIVFYSVFEPSKQYSMDISLSFCSRDAELVKRMDADVREHRLASARLLVQTLFAQYRAKLFINRITIPALFLLSGQDTIVSTAESLKIFKRLINVDKAVKVYPEMLHALSIDLGRESVFEEIYSWIKARV